MTQQADIDRLFERLANAEGFLRTAQMDLRRFGLAAEAGAIGGALLKTQEVSDALVRWEYAHQESRPE